MVGIMLYIQECILTGVRGPFSTNVFKLGPKNDVITNVMNLSKITKTMNYKRSRTGNNSAMIFKLIQIS